MLSFWTPQIKRLARKTIFFSKLEEMHDTVIGLLINKVEFGLDIHANNTFATKQPFSPHESVLSRESFQIAAQY